MGVSVCDLQVSSGLGRADRGEDMNQGGPALPAPQQTGPASPPGAAC